MSARRSGANPNATGYIENPGRGACVEWTGSSPEPHIAVDILNGRHVLGPQAVLSQKIASGSHDLTIDERLLRVLRHGAKWYCRNPQSEIGQPQLLRLVLLLLTRKSGTL